MVPGCQNTILLILPLKKSTFEEDGGGGQRLKVGDHVSACAQTAKPQLAAQHSITNKSLRVQESGDGLLRSPSHEFLYAAAELKGHFMLFSPSALSPIRLR